VTSDGSGPRSFSTLHFWQNEPNFGSIKRPPTQALHWRLGRRGIDGRCRASRSQSRAPGARKRRRNRNRRAAFRTKALSRAQEASYG
jgi:hypothetical protein